MTEEPFAGNDRFQVRRRLGRGSFGTVYEAMDRQHNAVIAVKVLHETESRALYRFKQEFRLLSDLVHPNLVTLYELLSQDDRWFFSMERIEGCHLLEHVRVHPSRLSGEIGFYDETNTVLHLQERARATQPSAPEAEGAPGGLAPDVSKLRETFAALTRGIQALHAAHILHRDVKPSNVMVTPAGRVVLLDFGLAKELTGIQRVGGALQADEIAGSPAYMSPEHWGMGKVSEASDWYSVGVILFEALTGQRPFVGTDHEKMQALLAGAPVPSAKVQGIPADLDALCRDLLNPEPRARPSGDEVLRRLEGRPVRAPARPADDERMVGRAPQLEALARALARSRDGQATIAFVHGASGMGKSALLRAFTVDLRDRGEVVVLSGRCHERESVPYKALDSLVDSLSRHLGQLPEAEARELIPPDVQDLWRLFPVLRPGPAPDEPVPGEPRSQEPLHVRHRALRALKAILGGIALRKPLVLSVDDLQWGDVDGARLLVELLSPPNLPPLLLLASYRDEDAATSPCLLELRRLLPSSPVAVTEIPIGKLDEAEMIQLVRARLGQAVPDTQVQRLAREAQGNPFFAEELARQAQSLEGEPSGTPVLSDVIQARLQPLPPLARRLLESVSVAGRPLDQHVAIAAAELGDAALPSLSLLRANRLLRLHGTEHGVTLDTVHDRIRESVLARVAPAEIAGHHRRLVRAISTVGTPDPEVLAFHLHGAGEDRAAAVHAFRAAEASAAALAFAHAADLYGQALEWSVADADPTLPERRSLQHRRAEAIAAAGRGGEAARLFLEVAAKASPEESRRLRQRAAELSLSSGRIDEGLEVLGPLMREHGLKLHASPGAAIRSGLLLFLKLKLRGNKYNQRPGATVDPELLSRFDVCWAVGKALADVDARALPFQIRSVLLGLEAGEPRRLIRALSLLGTITAWDGKASSLRQGSALLAQAEEMARKLGEPVLLGISEALGAIPSMVRGDWNVASERLASGIALLEEHGLNEFWEIYMSRVFLHTALDASGQLRRAHDLASSWHVEALKRGDVFSRASASLCLGADLLAAGDPEGARSHVREGLASWTSQQGYHVQHIYTMRLNACADLYQGMPAEAWRRISADWPKLRSSGLLRAHSTRLDMYSLRGRAAVALAASGPGDHEKVLKAAEDDAARLEKELRRDAAPVARGLRAGAAWLRGQGDAALAHLARAVEGFDAAGMPLHAEHARLARGLAMGGVEGAALVSSAEEKMRGAGVKDPRRWAAIHLPGFSR